MPHPPKATLSLRPLSIGAIWPWLVFIWLAGVTLGLVAASVVPAAQGTTPGRLAWIAASSLLSLGITLWLLNNHLKTLGQSRDWEMGKVGEDFGRTLAQRERFIGHE